ncbi:hypothetical protein DFQ28_002648 [Apophysomyces sp. BC1034]|nr:hypothetical protein DFQ30_003229 [Apophysomyces sp. BC1015]KAG0179661.1 hypothetical protein DFQ29_001829 [Apophysomyces sp. BC1021]KAG0189982.1 hypothetical protein DFQ28_002648 [Apophysomyces sp. BC1034]
MTITLRILPDEFTLYQWDRSYQISHDLLNLPWYTLSRTASELSLLVPSDATAPDLLAASKKEPDWRCLQVDAQMDFGLVGILASIINPLRDNQIPVFAVSTFDTDYVLVKKEDLEKAIGALNVVENIVLKPGESVQK